jgi:DNA topoisomerase-1
LASFYIISTTSKLQWAILASDHDREGEAIAWHLVQVLKNEIKDKPVHRIVFNEITRNAIQKAMENPGKIDDQMVESQQARRILDRIVGYNISPLLWKIITKNLSAGRVQTVALRLICDKEEAIQKFEPQEYWNIEALLYKNDLPPFKATLQKWDGKNIRIIEKAKTDEILNSIKNSEFTLSKLTNTQKKYHPLPPFITSTLQQDASRVLNFSAKKTMQQAQQLYEGIDLGGEAVGLITYMRTDSLRVSSQAVNFARKLIKERFGEGKLNSTIRFYKNKNKAQDAHEAIRPTNPFRTPESINQYLSKDQLRLYTLIWQRFIATQMVPILVDMKNLDISIGKALFTANGGIVIEKGFLESYPHYKVILGEKIDQDYKTDDILQLKKIEGIQLFTKPPSRFTEAALIKELESKGIGRPSTYATITNTIRLRKYVELKARIFHPTQLGMAVYKFLISNFDEFFNVQFTANMENSLDKIEYGEVDRQNLLSEYYGSIQKLIGNINYKEAKEKISEDTNIKCEKCGSKMIIKWGKNGQFLACSNFPECKNIKSFFRSDDGQIKIIEPKKLEEKCPKCNSALILKEGRYGKFIACSNYPKCKFTKPFTLGIKCPECKDGEITEKRNKKGKYFFSCTNYPECKFITNFKPIELSCPKCGNYYLEERKTKTKGNFKKCPQCGEEVF